MKLGLLTTKFGEQSTHGVLFVNGKFFGYTIEDVFRNPFVKVANKTAIQGGFYRCAYTFSNRFKRNLLLVLNVDGFNGIRIHEGNNANDSSGCILVGKEYDINGIYKSKIAIEELNNLAVNAIQKDEKIELMIARCLSDIQKYSGFFPISPSVWMDYIW